MRRRRNYGSGKITAKDGTVTKLYRGSYEDLLQKEEDRRNLIYI